MNGQFVSITGRSVRRRRSRLRPLRVQDHRYKAVVWCVEGAQLRICYTNACCRACLQAPADSSYRSQALVKAAAESQALQGSAMV